MLQAFEPAGTQESHTFSISSHNLERHFNFTTSAGNTAMVANLAIYVPFWLVHPVTVYETWVETGTLTTSNSTQIGVYDLSGNRLFATATTVATASDTVNSSGMTDFVLDAGTYYLAFAADGTRNILGSALAAGIYQSMGCVQQAGLTGATLPSTATFAVYTQAFLPLFGLNLINIAL